MAIVKGQIAPDFSLFDTEKQKVSLGDFKGKNVIILFFPLAFTSVCTAELCHMSADINRYNNANVQILGISVDSLFTLAKFKSEQNIVFPLLSDFNKEASTAYNCLYNNWLFDMKGISKRAAFVLDTNGVIRYGEVLEDANNQVSFEGINKAVEQLDHVKLLETV